jgi:hypothetical protein
MGPEAPRSAAQPYDPIGNLLHSLLVTAEPAAYKYDVVASLLNFLTGRANVAAGEDAAAKYDPGRDILALEAAGGAAKYDPLMVMSLRAGDAFVDAVHAFEELRADADLEAKHGNMFAALAAAADAQAGDKARYDPAWSILRGGEVFDVQLASFLKDVAVKYDPLHELVKGREHKEVVAVMCTMNRWLDRAEKGRRQAWGVMEVARDAARVVVVP